MHDDLSPIRFVIPGLPKPAPYLIRGNPVSCWIPALARMTGVVMIDDTMHESYNFNSPILKDFYRLPRLDII
jgi:hypothetical protein